MKKRCDTVRKSRGTRTETIKFTVNPYTSKLKLWSPLISSISIFCTLLCIKKKINPKKTETAVHWAQGTSSKLFCPNFTQVSPNFGCQFCNINAHSAIVQMFAHILPKFPQILPGFYGISPIQNFWGCGCTLASYTSENDKTALHRGSALSGGLALLRAFFQWKIEH